MKAIVLFLIGGVLLLGCSQASENPAGSEKKEIEMKSAAPAPEAKEVSAAPAETHAATAEKLVVLATTKGRIVIRLFDQDAPRHCESFRSLVGKGFYDRTYFHRLVDNFVIQGGDPNTKDDDELNDGRGNPGYTIKNEANRWKHKRGRVAAARGGHPDSAGSQFYICLTELPFLDTNRYTVFGEVVEGMDVVDKIVNVPKKRQRPTSTEVSYPLEKTYINKATIVSSEELKKE
jgi:peptidyl-prolyl cis-trans isomerase B (cyclophilin B)